MNEEDRVEWDGGATFPDPDFRPGQGSWLSSVVICREGNGNKGRSLFPAFLHVICRYKAFSVAVICREDPPLLPYARGHLPRFFAKANQRPFSILPKLYICSFRGKVA